MPSLRPGLPLRLLRWLLWPLSPVYGLVVWLRLFLYRRGWLPVHQAAVPVVAVGNLTLGGSGKTPVVETLLRMAQRQGHRPAILSRGYGGSTGSFLLRTRMDEGMPARPELMGDEPFLLASRNPQVPVIVGKERVEGARLAVIQDGATLLLMDDGYQHLRLKRDLNVLLLDGQTGLNSARLLPLGNLREPLQGLHRADVILITKVEPEQGAALREELQGRFHPSAPIFTAGYRPVRLRRLDGVATLPLASLHGKKLAALCAIAQPEGFAGALVAQGAQVEQRLFFRDHFSYPAAELTRLEHRLAQAHPDEPYWITTEKDAVKLRGRLTSGERLWVLEMEVILEPAAAEFFSAFFAEFFRESVSPRASPGQTREK